ncbi:MAG: hypothetical protein ACRD1S_08550 [Vicinamibacterales bacterium]
MLLVALVWNVVREPIRRQDPPLVVNDVTQLNPIAVGRILARDVLHARRHGGHLR